MADEEYPVKTPAQIVQWILARLSEEEFYDQEQLSEAVYNLVYGLLMQISPEVQRGQADAEHDQRAILREFAPKTRGGAR